MAGNGRRTRSSRATSADKACAEPCNLSALDPMAPRSKGTTLVTRRVVVTVLLVAMGASACSRSKAMHPAKPSSGDNAGSGADIRHGRARPGELHVLVVDGSGAPLSGVSVSGEYQKNSTGIHSALPRNAVVLDLGGPQALSPRRCSRSLSLGTWRCPAAEGGGRWVPMAEPASVRHAATPQNLEMHRHRGAALSDPLARHFYYPHPSIST